MKNYIFIVTKEGRIFNNDGVQHVFDSLFGDKADHNSVVEMGDNNNSPFILSRNLKKHINTSYIVLSDNGLLTYISGEDNIRNIIRVLDNNETANSWDLIKNFVKENK